MRHHNNVSLVTIISVPFVRGDPLGISGPWMHLESYPRPVSLEPWGRVFHQKAIRLGSPHQFGEGRS